MSYIAYLDMLGIKDLAQFDFDRFYRALTSMQKNILSSLNIDNVDKNVRIYYFSDSLFVEAHDIESLVTYLSYLRTGSITGRFYFKCSVIKGSLLTSSAIDVADDVIGDIKTRYAPIMKQSTLDEINADIDDINIYKESVKDRAYGTTFHSPDVCYAVSLESNFKGVGFFVKLDTSEYINDFFVESFYIYNKSIHPFHDIKISDSDKDLIDVDLLLKDISMANLGSQYLGTKYISLLATYINSVNFKNINVERSSNTLKTGIKIVDALITLQSKMPRLFGKLKGLPYLYLLVLNNFYSVQKFDDANLLLAKFLKMGTIITRFEGKFDTIPECVVSTKNILLLKQSYYNLHIGTTE